ncbi:MAG TPA: hypothetical protein VNL77_08040 [Roseiflexaceae bacterium]|nr:hypothetical protein [Roseiflexaceae bacterium]
MITPGQRTNLLQMVRARVALGPTARGAACVVLAAAVVYAALLASYLQPINGFWSSDQGVKLIQVQSLIRNRYRSTALIYPGAALDPERQVSPLRGQYLERGGRVYAMFPDAFAALSGAPFFLFGYPGLYLLPAGATLALLAVCAALGRRLMAPLWTTAALAILALASPLLFYSLTFWEHTLAALLVTLALLAAVEGLLHERPRLLLLGGALVGMAACFRNETALAAPALALALLLARPARPAMPLAWLVVGTALGVAPLLFFNQAVYGAALGPHVLVAGRANNLTAGEGLAGFVAARAAWAGMLIAPLDDGLLLGGLALLVLTALAAWAHQARTIPTAALYAAALALVAVSLALQLRPSAGLQTSLLATFPLVLLALLPAAPGTSPAPRRIAHLLVCFGLAYILLAWVVRLPDGGAQWGPRMLLPALPPLALAGLWRASTWAARGAGPTFAVAAAIALLVNVAALSEVEGLRQLRAFNRSNHQITTTVDHSGERVVITDTWYAPPLLAPLFYDGRLVFLVDDGRDLDALLDRMQRAGITSFYYLGARQEEIAAGSRRWPGLTPAGEVQRLPQGLNGAVYRLRPGFAARLLAFQTGEARWGEALPKNVCVGAKGPHAPMRVRANFV